MSSSAPLDSRTPELAAVGASSQHLRPPNYLLLVREADVLFAARLYSRASVGDATTWIDTPPRGRHDRRVVPSERVQRQIDRLLDEAEQALVARDWERVRLLAEDALRLDPDNGDARSFLDASQRDAPAAATPVSQPPAP